MRGLTAAHLPSCQSSLLSKANYSLVSVAGPGPVGVSAMPSQPSWAQHTYSGEEDGDVECLRELRPMSRYKHRATRTVEDAVHMAGLSRSARKEHMWTRCVSHPSYLAQLMKRTATQQVRDAEATWARAISSFFADDLGLEGEGTGMGRAPGGGGLGPLAEESSVLD